MARFPFIPNMRYKFLSFILIYEEGQQSQWNEWAKDERLRKRTNERREERKMGEVGRQMEV